MKPTMLDLFCGTKSMSNVFKKGGYEVTTLDFDKKHKPDLCINILDFDITMLHKIPDVVHASPDCSCFSMAAIGHHWNPDKTPKTEKCVNALKMLEKTVDIILELGCIAYVENPRCFTRKQDAIKRLEDAGFKRHTVTYCQYGDIRMKPTDIWTNNINWIPRKMCKNGDPCHEAAPRGSKTGTQGLKCSVTRSMIPNELCIELMDAVRSDMAKPARAEQMTLD